MAMPNPYYDPGEMGLRVVAELEYSAGTHDYDTRVVWADAAGKLYTARDEGCSCPTPFEDYRELDALEVVTDITFLRNEVISETLPVSSCVPASDAAAFIKKVRDALSDPASVAFDQETHDREKQENEIKKAIIKGLNHCYNEMQVEFPGVLPQFYAGSLAGRVPTDLSVAETFVLGVYLVTQAEQQMSRAAVETAE